MTLRLILSVFAGCLAAGTAAAQLAVTTFGATDAQQCYENARDDFSRDSDPCDEALKGALSSVDKKKTLVNRGIILNRDGSLDEAMRDFNLAIAIDSSLGEAFLNRGNTQLLSGAPDAALADYQKAIALDVNKPWAAWYNMGLAYEYKGDKARAREAYEKAVEINPDFSQAQSKIASLQ
jgi:tetratricopeptide (TPR) repeat protein